jgi:hypothetical protein
MRALDAGLEEWIADLLLSTSTTIKIKYVRGRKQNAKPN